MKQRPLLGFPVVLVVLLLGGGVGLMLQRQERIALEGELESERDAQRELERLQSENTRLRARQVPAEKLAALRADHAAVARLRAELEALKKEAGTKP